MAIYPRAKWIIYPPESPAQVIELRHWMSEDQKMALAHQLLEAEISPITGARTEYIPHRIEGTILGGLFKRRKEHG